MLHAVHFDDGKATYRNRAVRTTGMLAEQAAGASLWPGLLEPGKYTRRGWGAIGAMKDNAGTDVWAHGGKLVTVMSQGSEPWRLDPETLETLGPDPAWAQLIPDGVSAHGKVDPRTGEMMFFNYPEHAPFMNYGIIDKDNQLVHYTPIELPGPRWPHDLGITQNYTVLHDFPFFFDPEGLKHGVRKLEFHRDMPARYGIVPRHGGNKEIYWFEGTPCFVLHITNCFEDGNEVVMDGCISYDPQMPPVAEQSDPTSPYAKITRHLDKHNTRTRIHRWRFDLSTGKTHEELLDDEVTEFPVTNNDYVGRPYRYSYNTLFEKGAWLFVGIKRYDLLTGSATRYEYGPGRYGSEPAITLRPQPTAEDDGYVVTLVTDLRADRSECIILDAADLAAGPVARIILPERISTGTQATWIEADRIDGEHRSLV
jgi:carotenoid cleavage dioxygenase